MNNVKTYKLNTESDQEGLTFTELENGKMKIIYSGGKYIGDQWTPEESEVCGKDKARFVWGCWTERGYRKVKGCIASH